MKRVFIAIKTEPGPDLLRMISLLKKTLASESIRWVEQGNLHLTLTFLGETEEKIIRILCGALDERCKGFGTFSIVLSGTGIFKNYRDPRVVWTGILPSPRLDMINGLVMNTLNDLQIRIEDRPFKPHLTIGRIRSLSDNERLKSIIEEYKNTDLQEVAVNEIILYESILLPAGPLYKPLKRFDLT